MMSPRLDLEPAAPFLVLLAVDDAMRPPMPRLRQLQRLQLLSRGVCSSLQLAVFHPPRASMRRRCRAAAVWGLFLGNCATGAAPWPERDSRQVLPSAPRPTYRR